ncbi:helix-turn-helix domain-containing protein [Pseudonocardia abyssalis]|uniref:Helix-turn-helix domain-containing protein n=1 Tax=Pseudonocardia abyssalis TaxID=2792008 RepID=A0ABS6UR32_9PSEU|nr:helix-turn-helix domain-containing protein [Pseudonocardia abyssalis]MBW0115948.1 helix-turn-helix domain-containing protein [Pseudonocardia abyssalis]MBW0134723.1 helix-turn-helix domain-containing protein [Pseudonocardia abyssalis]
MTLSELDLRAQRDSLADLLQTLPADVGEAAGDLAGRASLLSGTPVTVAAWTGERWTALAGPGTGVAGLPQTGVTNGSCRSRQGVIAADGGSVAVCWDPSARWEPEWTSLLRQACAWLSLLLRQQTTTREIDAAGAEAGVIRDVVRQLLSVRDVDRLLLSVAERTMGLLDADICGVMLREGDVVRMRSCVGNRVAETARLRMHRGQGVAGLVFLTGEPAKVDSYLDDETISHDFMSLAEREETRSALAVPLRLQGEFIGVLEVWRRRRSIFTEHDIRRMVTLADFATIAIDNARLHDEQAASTAETERARDALQHQVAVLDHSSRLQQTLLTTVIEGGGLPAIARTVAVELDCEVGVYGPDGAMIASHTGSQVVGSLPGRLPESAATRRAVPREPTHWIRPVYADGDQVGRVLLVQGRQSSELMEAVAGQVAMACSLALLRQRAASRARSEAIEQVLWDLLQGPVEHRVAARTRAQQLGVTLTGALRVVHGQIDNVEDLAAQEGWDTSQTDRVRRDVLRTVRSLDDGRGLTLASLRGDLLVAIAADIDPAAAKDLVAAVSAAVHRDQPGLRVTWGVSREHDDAIELPSALNEARTALSAARRLGGHTAFLYEELGIVRLLLGTGDDPDLQTFIDDVTGPLVAYDRDNDGALVRSLRVFFESDCSQRVAAERLFIHHKTLRYRLERIRQLTGLDLSRHEDRMRADFALRLLQINRTATEETG